MLDELVREATDTLRLPEVSGEQCVHSHIENSHCRSCVVACPQQAWVIDDEQLGIVADRCDGCGICAAVCPEQAISHEYELSVGQWQQRGITVAACEKAGLTSGEEAVIPCLHGLGLHDVLKLYRQGSRYLFTLSGKCAGCERAQYGQGIEQTVAELNQLLRDRDCPPLRHQATDAAHWLGIKEKISPGSGVPPLNRRNFFRHAVAEAMKQGLSARGLDVADPTFVAVGALLPPTTNPQARWPFVPKLDETRCTGCDACLRACPHGVIEFVHQEGEAKYSLKVEKCTGCEICVAVCDADAVMIAAMAPQYRSEVLLEVSRCRHCGIEMHRPRRETRQSDLCHICERVPHRKNLYQVLD